MLTASSHVHANAIHWTVFHGNNRTKRTRDLGAYDIVLTTYHTVLAEWKKGTSAGVRNRRPIHRFSWYRIVLDEGIHLSPFGNGLHC